MLRGQLCSLLTDAVCSLGRRPDQRQVTNTSVTHRSNALAGVRAQLLGRGRGLVNILEYSLNPKYNHCGDALAGVRAQLLGGRRGLGDIFLRELRGVGGGVRLPPRARERRQAVVCRL